MGVIASSVVSVIVVDGCLLLLLCCLGDVGYDKKIIIKHTLHTF